MNQTCYFENDLPSTLVFEGSVAVDTEAMGLNPHRDRLCLVQLADKSGNTYFVHFKDAQNYHKAKNLKRLLSNPAVTKIFHYARFDIAILKHYLGVDISPLFCTKIASKLARTYTQRHGLENLCREILGVTLNKEAQCSDWGAQTLTTEQLNYAANDVIYLHALKTSLEDMLRRTHRYELADSCFNFLPTRAAMDLLGWSDDYIFQH